MSLNWQDCPDEYEALKQFKRAFAFYELKNIDIVVKPGSNLVRVEADVVGVHAI